jgi:N-acetylglucosamine-6-phosphate deacetylase
MLTALCNARVLIGSAFHEGKAVLLQGAKILAVVDAAEAPLGARRVDLDGGMLVPGFIDTQVNGGDRILFNDVPTVEGLSRIGAAHRRFGTTGFLPTLISADLAMIEQAMHAVDAAIAAGVPGVIGIHIEGPFLSEKRAGIHDPTRLRALDAQAMAVLTRPSRGRVLVTLAPEVTGPAPIRALVAKGVIVAIGHSAATYEEAMCGLEAGASGFTHLFNAMSPFTSRAPGVVGAALDSQTAWCGLIVDGAHVHPATLRVALRSRPADRFMLVTDAMPPVGTDDQGFSLGGRKITVQGDSCFDDNGTLAGTALTMVKAVRNVVDLLGLDLLTAIALASGAPAGFLGLSQVRGQIAPRLLADLALLDDDLSVRDTWIGGVSTAHDPQEA